jgi:hypothetical protein
MRQKLNSNCIELGTPLHLFGDGVSTDVATVKMNVELHQLSGSRSMRTVWLEQMAAKWHSVQNQIENIEEKICCMLVGDDHVAEDPLHATAPCL